MPASITFTQNHFRGRNDDGTEATATWKAALDTNWTQVIGEPFRVRIHVSRANEGVSTNGSMGLYSSLNGGAYALIDSTIPGNAAHARLSSTLDAQGTDTTQQLEAGTYLVNNNGVNNDADLAQTDTATWTNGIAQGADMEFSIYLDPTIVVPGDQVSFRCYFNDTVFSGGYTYTPTVTAVSKATMLIKGSTVAVKGRTITLKGRS